MFSGDFHFFGRTMKESQDIGKFRSMLHELPLTPKGLVPWTLDPPLKICGFYVFFIRHSNQNEFLSSCSTTIQVSQSQVHQNLAHLVRWADHILMNGQEALNKESAHEIISSLENAVKVRAKFSLRIFCCLCI